MKGIITLLTLAFSMGLVAQNTGEIQGKIVDSQGLPLIYASVSVQQGEKEIGTFTDLEGNFSIKPLASGEYNLKATMIGFTDYVLQGVEVSSSRLTILKSIKLQEAVTTITGGPVIVEYITPLIEPDNPSLMEVKAATLEKMPVKNNIGTLLTALSSEIKSDDNGELYFRGSRAGSVQYFIDGIKYTGVAPFIPTAALSSMSVYTGGIPARYGDVVGGVVVLETKSYFELYNAHKNKLREQGLL